MTHTPRRTAEPSGASRSKEVLTAKPGLTRLMLGLAALWAVLGVTGVALNLYAAPNDTPPRPLLMTILTPAAFVLLLYGLSNAFRRWVAALDMALLTALHGVRTIGFAFIVMWYYGTVSPVFAFPAALGDMAVALMAPFAALALARCRPGAVKQARAVHLAGLADFAIAVVLGASSLGVPASQMHQIDPINVFPLALIPAVGVPFLLASHVLALLHWRSAKAP